MAKFTSTAPLNLVYKHRLGARIEIVADRKAGIPLPPGTEFEIPDEIADDFLAQFGPRPGDASVTPGAAAEGLIPGLTRVS